jgi:hypothetical protein
MSYIAENTLHFHYKNNWLIFWKEIIVVCFKNLTKKINNMCAKQHRNFIDKWVAHTINTGLWKVDITMCLYSIVYRVTAARSGLWINGIKQDLALQERETGCMRLDHKRKLEK